MDYKTLIETRQSCRKFDVAKQVAQEDIDYCLEAGRLAPSACNAQPYKFVVCKNEAARDAAKCIHSMGANKFVEDANCFIVICEDNYSISAALGSKIKDQDFRSIDIGIAAAHITLAATEKGLDTCMLGWFDEKRLIKMLNIKSRIRLVIALGYCVEGYPIREKKRKSLKEIVDIR